MKNILCAFLVICCTALNSYSQLKPSAKSKHSAKSKFPSYKGLIMAGYQGWHNTPDDGAGFGWGHYLQKGEFGPGNIKVDMWPKYEEYEVLHKTPFVLADGSTAYLPSDFDASTTNLHFKWMKEYGIDGVFMQRFISCTRKTPANAAKRNHFLKVLGDAFTASQKNNRAIAVMYDLTGMRKDTADVNSIIDDWKNLVDSMKVTSCGNKQTYLYHNGKPLVVLWGVGFGDSRSYGYKSIEQIMDFLKNDPVYGGCSIMLGVPTYWRELGRDTDKDPHLHDVLRKADIVHPWTVGRFKDEASYLEYAKVQKADLAWCKQNKLDYVHVAFPGFSWHNLNNGSAFDLIPRNRGKFYWKQLSTAISDGAEMIYIAMFDEIDEGTAIYKVTKKPPVGPSPFIVFEEDIPSDYYLFLTGYAAKMLRKEVPVQSVIPVYSHK